MRAAIAILLLLAATPLLAQQKILRERGSQFILTVGQEAPVFSFVTTNGDTLDSDLLRGQVILVDFVASWCPFTPAQMEDHKKNFWEKLSSNPAFQMLTISIDRPDNQQTFLNIANEIGLTSPLIFDTDEQLYQLFVTPNGSVTRSLIIAPDWTIALLQDKHTRRGMRQIKHTLRHLLRSTR